MPMEKTLIKDLPSVLFVTGIGTDVGKSWATGWLARELRSAGVNTITQKFIQTGNHDFSEDIAVHRKVMGIDLLPRDLDHTTAPIILSYPASPHLAEKLDKVKVDYDLAARATKVLSGEYDCVLIEGAGGVTVPLRGKYLTLDYIREHDLPAVVVSNGQLGSINHTILTLMALREAGVEIWGVIYNPYFDKDPVIAGDGKEYMRQWIGEFAPEARYLVMPDSLS